MIDRVMMRCTLPTCRRWVSVVLDGPQRTMECPSCASVGVVSYLEPVDMAAHLASLPIAVDPSKPE